MIARARVRRRVRRLAPPRAGPMERALDRSAYGRRLARRLRAADVPWSAPAFVRLVLGAALVGAAFAVLWVGPPAGPVGFLAGGLAPGLALRRRLAQRSARVVAQLPEALACVAAAMRAGASLPQALVAAAEEAEAPLRDLLAGTCRDLDSGVPQDQAIERFAQRCAVPGAVLAARALRIGRFAGGAVPQVLDEVVETLRDRDRLSRELRAGTAQARVSATVVAALPVVFLFLMSAGARDQARLLFREPVGWLLLGVGGALEGAGLLWMRRLSAAPGGARGGLETWARRAR